LPETYWLKIRRPIWHAFIIPFMPRVENKRTVAWARQERRHDLVWSDEYAGNFWLVVIIAFSFTLFKQLSGGSQAGIIIEPDDVTVSSGQFTVELDFGQVFDGTELWLQVGVRPGIETGAYTILVPRQALRPTPYAIYAANADWTGLKGMPPGFSDNVDDDTLAAIGCSNGQIIEWNGNIWVCGDDDVGAGGGGGQDNDATAEYATVGGGYYNEAVADYTTIAGGGLSDPFAIDPWSTRNTVTDDYWRSRLPSWPNPATRLPGGLAAPPAADQALYLPMILR
jgi:hypothetical protein